MASIYKIKESELIGGISNDDLYPVTSTQAIYSQGSDGSKPYGVAKILEDRLQEGEQSLNNLSDKTYRKSETYNRQEIDNRINTVRTGLFVVVDALPDASVDTLGKIYLVQGTGDTKQEYITVNNGTPEQPDFDWENIGSTSIDLENYSTTEEMEAALDALRDELLEDITDLGNAVYTKDEVYNKLEITEQFNNVAQFRPEWAPYGQLPEANEATMNRLFLVKRSKPEKNNLVDEYITIRVAESPYGPIGSMEGEELQNDDDVHVTYKWEKVGGSESSGGGSTEAYEIVDLGEQSEYSGTYPDGTYTIQYEGSLLEELEYIWITNRLPIIIANLASHNINTVIALYKNADNVFSGYAKSEDGSYSIDVNIQYTTKVISIRSLYSKPAAGIPKTDLTSEMQVSLGKADTAIQYTEILTDSSGTTDTEITIESATVYTTESVYILNPGETIKYICQSVNHATYIINAGVTPKTILRESNWGEVNYTNTTNSVLYVQGACISNGDDFTVHITRPGLASVQMSIVEASGTSLVAKVSTLYRFTESVNTLTITLPAISDYTHAHEIEFLFTTGSSPALTFTDAGGGNVMVQEGLTINSGCIYELNAMWEGSWIIAGIVLATSIN